MSGSGDDIASLGIAVDSTQAATAAGNLDKLTAASGKAQTAAQQLASATGATASETANYNAKLIAAMQAQYGMTAAEAAATLGIKTLGDETEATATKVVASTTSMRLSMMQSVGVMQVLRGALSGNLEMMAGSSAVLASRFGLLTGSTLLWAGAIAAIAAPFGILLYEMAEGTAQAAKLNNAIQITGNYAGINADQFNNLANSISSKYNVSIGSVEQNLTQVIGTGKFTSETFSMMTADAVRFADYTGQSSSKVLSAFEDMSKGVYKYAQDFNSQYHFLTDAQLLHIQFLENEGKTSEAEFEFEKERYNWLGSQAPAQLGVLQGAWRSVQNAISGALQALRDFGKAPTLQQKVRSDQAALSSDVSGSEDQGLHIKQLRSDTAALNAQTNLNIKQTNGSRQSQQQQEALDGVSKGFVKIKNSAQEAREEVSRFNQAYAGLSAAGQAQFRQNQGYTGSGADFLKDEDTAISKRYDAAAFRKPKAAHEDKTDKFEDETAKISKEAEALGAMAQGFDLNAYAALKAKAAADAYTAALEASQGPKGQVISQADIDARTQANLDKAIFQSIDASAKLTNTTRSRADAQSQINTLLAAGNITEQDASRQVSQLAERQGLVAIALNGTAAEAIQATIQLELLTRAQDALNKSDDAAALIKFNTGREKLAPDVADRQGAGAAQGQSTAMSEAQKTGQAIITLEQSQYKTRLANRQTYVNQIDAAIIRNEITEKQGIASVQQYDLATQNARLQSTSNFLTALNSLGQLKSEEAKEIAKVAAIANATIHMYEAISFAYASPPGWPLNAANVIGVGIEEAANIAKIAGLAGGGPVSGDGGGRDDNQLRRLSSGEYVINQEAAARNRPLLDQINNSGRAVKMASGGPVGGAPLSPPSGGTVIHADFTQANFGGADPDVIMDRFDKAMRQVYGPAIVVQATKTTMITQNKNQNRQVLNRKSGAQR